MKRIFPCAVAILITLVVPIGATPPNPVASSLFVPIEGDIVEPGTTNILHLTGEVHVVTHFTVSDQRVFAVSIWANLVRVRGTSQATGNTYLAVGRATSDGAASTPALPIFRYSSSSSASSTSAQALVRRKFRPVLSFPSFRNFRFGAEDTNFGKLQDVDAGFEP
jgi:hypothetical protein